MRAKRIICVVAREQFGIAIINRLRAEALAAGGAADSVRLRANIGRHWSRLVRNIFWRELFAHLCHTAS